MKIIFEIGQTVFHRMDVNQDPKLIVGIIQRPNNIFTYLATGNGMEQEYFEIELSNIKTII